MSFLSDSVPAVNPALEPANIRKGGPAAQHAYQVGLAFEQMLVDQLSQELTASAGGTADGSGGSGDGTDSSSGLMGSDPASSTYAQMLPQALSSGVMSAGGLGVAAQIAGALDPSIGGPQ
jgi:Rod binding domain-containing protein